LDEYFKAKGMDDAIDYKTKPEGSGYRSTVFCPELGYADGEIRPTERKAEQSAAKKALEQLQSM